MGGGLVDASLCELLLSLTDGHVGEGGALVGVRYTHDQSLQREESPPCKFNSIRGAS